MTKVEQALKAMENIDTLRKEAVDELLTQRNEIDKQLRTLGHGEGKVIRARRVVDPNTPCPICNFVTAPAHDARKHRGQGDKKKPFTPKELEELKMSKVAKASA